MITTPCLPRRPRGADDRAMISKPDANLIRKALIALSASPWSNSVSSTAAAALSKARAHMAQASMNSRVISRL